MSMFLLFVSLALVLAATVCLVAGQWVRPTRVKPALILLAMFWLLLGAGMQVKAWADGLDRRHSAASGIGEVKSMLLETLSIARTTKSPENRDEALGLAKQAAELIALDALDRGLPNQIVALISIVLGSVRLTLALTRPDILMTRRERETQIIKTTALAPQRGLSL